MVTYGGNQEQPSKGKPLCNHGHIELPESVSLPVKWARYTEGYLRCHLPLIICMFRKGSGRRSSNGCVESEVRAPCPLAEARGLVLWGPYFLNSESTYMVRYVLVQFQGQ